MKCSNPIFGICLVFLVVGCDRAPHSTIVSEPLRDRHAREEGAPLFEKLPPAQTGVDFSHRMAMNHPLSRLNSSGCVCGGVCIGDFNGDGVGDAADYTIYMDNLGGDSAVLGGNGSGASTVGQADYLLWKSSFGNTSGSGSSAAIPEPAALLLALLALAAAPVRVRCG